MTSHHREVYAVEFSDQHDQVWPLGMKIPEKLVVFLFIAENPIGHLEMKHTRNYEQQTMKKQTQVFNQLCYGFDILTFIHYDLSATTVEDFLKLFIYHQVM